MVYLLIQTFNRSLGQYGRVEDYKYPLSQAKEIKRKFGLLIEIEGKANPVNLGRVSLEYELDSLILKSSEDEMETAFVFMDGIAVQIKSLDVCVIVINPVILVYPRKNEVLNNVRMRDAIEGYRGHSWNGDFYSIALLYGEENRNAN